MSVAPRPGSRLKVTYMLETAGSEQPCLPFAPSEHHDVDVLIEPVGDICLLHFSRTALSVAQGRGLITEVTIQPSECHDSSFLGEPLPYIGKP